MESKSLIDMVDETTLDRTDRLGLAWCRLNQGQWDPILGAPPDFFEYLPPVKPWWKFWGRPAKWQEIVKVQRAIEKLIGADNVGRCWWKFGLGMAEDEWIRWWIQKNIRR